MRTKNTNQSATYLTIEGETWVTRYNRETKKVTLYHKPTQEHVTDIPLVDAEFITIVIKLLKKRLGVTNSNE